MNRQQRHDSSALSSPFGSAAQADPAATVSSTGALRAIEVLEQEIRRFNRQPLAEQYLRERGLGKYRSWIRRHLEQSDLSQRLPCGLEAFPDLTAALPWIIQPLERCFKHRSVEQVTLHLARNLEWYLEPTSKAPTNMAWQVGGTLGMLVVFLVSWAISSSLGGVFPLWGFFGPLFIGAVNAGNAVKLGGFSGESPSHERYLIHVMELHRYLSRAYSDVYGAENVVVTPLPAADHDAPQMTDAHDGRATLDSPQQR